MQTLIGAVCFQNMGLENNTLSFNLWVKPPVLPLVAVYVFNYTNVDEFEKGLHKKLVVEEIGPYVYR
jgi:TPP-dependent indolepyruvate ferredoxin oxidoreductase alpha subunit